LCIHDPLRVVVSGPQQRCGLFVYPRFCSKSHHFQIALGSVVAMSFSPAVKEDFHKTTRSRTAALDGADFVV
jgi:hypothetical protein